LTDARGCVRVAIRPADADDRRLLFEWANDPVTRTQSFSTEPVDWATHCEWFAQVLRATHRRLYVVTCAGDGADAVPIGQVRFDATPAGDAHVSVSLASAWRGRGLAADAIRMATHAYVDERRVRRILAFIKPQNLASRGAFVKAGYQEAGSVNERDADVLVFEFVPAAT
jgi:RimJ/RimL family protein N-acetyltransferase